MIDTVWRLPEFSVLIPFFSPITLRHIRDSRIREILLLQNPSAVTWFNPPPLRVSPEFSVMSSHPHEGFLSQSVSYCVIPGCHCRWGLCPLCPDFGLTLTADSYNITGASSDQKTWYIIIKTTVFQTSTVPLKYILQENFFPCSWMQNAFWSFLENGKSYTVTLNSKQTLTLLIKIVSHRKDSGLQCLTQVF